MSGPPFWMVWNGDPSGRPTVKHDTLESAEEEAKRLAKLNPDQNFWVLAAAVRIMATSFEIERFDVDTIPF